MFQSRETRALSRKEYHRWKWKYIDARSNDRQYTQQGNRWIILDDFANPSIGCKSCNTRESSEANVCNAGTRIQSVAEVFSAKFITNIILSCKDDNVSCAIFSFFIAGRGWNYNNIVLHLFLCITRWDTRPFILNCKIFYYVRNLRDLKELDKKFEMDGTFISWKEMDCG